MARHSGAHPPGRATIDRLLALLVARGGAPIAGASGEWVKAYQRVTHYLRAIDVWSPPPHVLAWRVVARAVLRGGATPPLRRAMEEVHVMLSSGRDAVRGPSRIAWEGSVRWRLGSWLEGGGCDVLKGDAPLPDAWGPQGPAPEPVPAAAPAAMIPQSLPSMTFGRLLTALSRMAFWPASAGGRRRRHHHA